MGTRVSKLDMYDCTIDGDVIRIKLVGTNDPDLVDIFSDISRTDGKLYCDGRYYQFTGAYDIYKIRNQSYIDLHVIETT